MGGAYGRGDEITLSTNGLKLKRRTPYDFVALTDHAKYFGVMPRLINPKDPLTKTALAKELAHPTVPPSDPKSAGCEYRTRLNEDESHGQ